MFWLKRLKESDADDNAWALSFGDLMSLLLVVFIMLAAMSELGSNQQFGSVRDSVRAAFGFSGDPVVGKTAGKTPKGLLDRLRESELSGVAVWTGGKDDACELIAEGDLITFRLAGAVAFDPHSAVLRRPAVTLLSDLAVELKNGTAMIEVRGHAGDGAMPEHAPFRDAFDLSYQRAHVVAELLERAGVARERMRMTACGGNVPMAEPARSDSNMSTDRRVEIVVHAVPAKTQLADVSSIRGMNGNG